MCFITSRLEILERFPRIQGKVSSGGWLCGGEIVPSGLVNESQEANKTEAK